MSDRRKICLKKCAVAVCFAVVGVTTCYGSHLALVGVPIAMIGWQILDSLCVKEHYTNADET